MVSDSLYSSGSSTDNDAVGRRIDSDDIKRFAPGYPHAATLADRVAVNPPVTADNPAICKDEITRDSFNASSFEKAGVVAVRDETDILTVALLRYRYPEFGSYPPHFALVAHFAKREDDLVQLFLPQ